jgi:hypothetical protein
VKRRAFGITPASRDSQLTGFGAKLFADEIETARSSFGTVVSRMPFGGFRGSLRGKKIFTTEDTG